VHQSCQPVILIIWSMCLGPWAPSDGLARKTWTEQSSQFRETVACRHRSPCTPSTHYILKQPLQRWKFRANPSERVLKRLHRISTRKSMRQLITGRSKLNRLKSCCKVKTMCDSKLIEAWPAWKAFSETWKRWTKCYQTKAWSAIADPRPTSGKLTASPASLSTTKTNYK